MTKWTLSKSTTHQNRFLIVGDSKIISKPENQKKIRNYPKDISAIKDIDNTKLTAIYSTSGIEFGGDECDIYINSNEKKKPTRFYYITDNSLNHTKVDSLITDIDNTGKKTGEVKIESGKICFHALGNTENKDSGYIAEWNNSFIFNVSNGIYEVFQFDFIYKENEIENCDTMFSVKKK